MSETYCDQLQAAFHQGGVTTALHCLVKQLREQKKYHEMFEALKMQLRHKLGLPLIYGDLSTTSTSEDLDEQLEQGLLDACRQVGMLLIEDGRIREGWMYLRPVGNRDEVAKKLAALSVDDEQMDELIEVCLHEGVDPIRGYGLVLERYGTCNAITTLEGQLQSMEKPIQQATAEQLVRHVYHELVTNAKHHVEQQEGQGPTGESLRNLIRDRDWLTNDGSYHIDTSHLSSTVRMGRVLDDEQQIDLVRQMCEYGARLDTSLQYAGEEPFVDNFVAHGKYFDVLLGERVDEGVQFFRQRAEEVDAHHEGTHAAEIYVELLVRCRRYDDAIAASIRHLPPGTHTRGVAPTLLDISRAANNYDRYIEMCREKNDLLGFATGILHAGQSDTAISK